MQAGAMRGSEDFKTALPEISLFRNQYVRFHLLLLKQRKGRIRGFTRSPLPTSSITALAAVSRQARRD